jgi:UrcA family protein
MNTTNIATRLIAGALFTALISGTSALASAAGDTDSLQKTVTYADSNVSTASGAAALYNRIRIASEEVCAPLGHGDLSSKMKVEACAHKAIAGAVSQVNQPALTAVYNAKNGAASPMIAAAK